MTAQTFTDIWYVIEHEPRAVTNLDRRNYNFPRLQGALELLREGFTTDLRNEGYNPERFGNPLDALLNPNRVDPDFTFLANAITTAARKHAFAGGAVTPGNPNRRTIAIRNPDGWLYAPGDICRIIDADSMGLPLEDNGQLIEINEQRANRPPTGATSYIARRLTGPNTGARQVWVGEPHIEFVPPVEPAPAPRTFEVGDRVQIIGPVERLREVHIEDPEDLIGVTAEIVDRYPHNADDPNAWFWNTLNAEGGDYAYPDDTLELA